MKSDNLEFGKTEKVLIFVNGTFGQELYDILSCKYSAKCLYKVMIEDIENKRIDILIINDRKSFNQVVEKYGLCLDRFFKIELSTINNDLSELLDKYFSMEIRQRGLVELLNQFKSLDEVIKLFPQGLITVKNEYEDADISIKSVTYTNGKQIFHGPTRDYRGETILFDKTSMKYFLLRGNLPVIHEYHSFTNIDENERTLVTPKYDGSLVNVTFIHKDSEVYRFIRNKPLKMQHIDIGIVFIGTRNLLISHDTLILGRFQRAVGGSINTFNTKLCSRLPSVSNIVFHFELMASDAFGIQAVTYGKTFCVLLGLTHFDESSKQFSLPKNEYSNCLKIHKFNSRFEVEEYAKSEHNKILNGDLSVEPEGFVIYTSNSVFKYKFPEYYVAHNPRSNLQDAFMLSEQLNGMTRYTKLQVPRSSKIAEISLLLNEVYPMSLEERYVFVKRNKSLLKKIDEAMNEIRFIKRNKFNVMDFLTSNYEINQEMFINYSYDFLKLV